MKKLITSVCIILIEMTASAQRIHHYNPTPTVIAQKPGTTSLYLGYNRRGLIGESSINLTQKLVLTGSYTVFNRQNASSMSPRSNTLNEHVAIAGLSTSYIHKLKAGKLAVEGQLGGSHTQYGYSDLPSTESDAVHMYRELVKYDEKALHFSVLLHLYKGKSDIYFGLKHVESKYGNLAISNSIFDESVLLKNTRSAGDGFVLGYAYRHNKLSVHAQVGLVSSTPTKLEQEETTYWWLFGSRNYTNTSIYPGTDFTSMIKVGYNLN